VSPRPSACLLVKGDLDYARPLRRSIPSHQGRRAAIDKGVYRSIACLGLALWNTILYSMRRR
jgi:hypothetical protein